MDSSSCGAHVHMLGARFGVRAAEDGHLTFLRAHAAVAHVGVMAAAFGGAWVHGMSRVAAAATLATHPMRADATGDRALRGGH
jgi:hypothetical protein